MDLKFLVGQILGRGQKFIHFQLTSFLPIRYFGKFSAPISVMNEIGMLNTLSVIPVGVCVCGISAYTSTTHKGTYNTSRPSHPYRADEPGQLGVIRTGQGPVNH